MPHSAGRTRLELLLQHAARWLTKRLAIGSWHKGTYALQAKPHCEASADGMHACGPRGNARRNRRGNAPHIIMLRYLQLQVAPASSSACNGMHNVPASMSPKTRAKFLLCSLIRKNHA